MSPEIAIVKPWIPAGTNAILYNKAHKESCKEQLQRLTGIANVNSVAQLKRWIEEKNKEVDST